MFRFVGLLQTAGVMLILDRETDKDTASIGVGVRSECTGGEGVWGGGTDAIDQHVPES